jgi:DNA-binding NtrC family response regulator
MDAGTLVAPLGQMPLAGQVGSNPPAELADFVDGLSFREQKERWTDEFERRYLAWLLGRSDGNISKAARDADMDRKYLHKLLKKHRIEPGE